MAELPTGTVTFLFTDLESSTRLWEEHRDAMKAALARHDEILRNAIESHGGHVVKTTGDGVHAAFASPADAVRAAVAAAQALVVEQWTAPEPLRVRMGAHTGVADVRDGDYYGPSLNRAARLMSSAHGGQIVVSLATEELARDDLGDGIDLVDLGEHQLRDVARPERVYQVTHPALPRDFPPLRTDAQVPGNLTAPVTSLVGRDADTARVTELLHAGRMVTLIGVGGVGKTRLAMHVASQVATGFPDGAWFCDLASVTTANGVALAVAETVGAGSRSERPPLDALVDFLRAKDLLLVLDNCEHLVDAAGSLADDVLRACPRVRLLTTSREALAVDGEHLWPVRPLPLPPDDADVARAEETPTVALFVDRVRAFRPEFGLDATNVGAVVDICRRLDGIPLALELAAARARSMSPADIASRLDRRFGLLTGGRRRAVARHETLRAAVDWSYDLLDDAERSLLQRVSVFAGGFTLEAAYGIAWESFDDDVFDVVTSLVDKSLLVVDDELGSTRYRMLETIRQYALEHLDDAGLTDDARDRHAAFFAEFAERAGAGLLSADEIRWADRTSAELDNIRAAVAWAAESGQADLALRLGTALATQVYYRQDWGIADLAHVALATEGAANDERYPVALATAGEIGVRRGAFGDSQALARQALAIVGDADVPAYWLAEMVLGTSAMMRSVEDAPPHFERALAATRRAGDTFDIVLAQQFLAIALPGLGPEHLDRALVEAREAMALATSVGSPSLLAQANFALGYTLIMRGDPTAGEHLAAAITPRAGAALSGTLGMLALHQMRFGSRTEALATIERAINYDVYIGDRGMFANSLDVLVGVLAGCDDPEGAAVVAGVLEGDAVPQIIRTGVPQERRAKVLQRLEARLGPEAWTAARARGAAMHFDEIVAFAVDRIDELCRRTESGADRD